MSYITTITGKHFDPIEPERSLIDIYDIAHSLSHVCRANGHMKHFYSVAQHSMACAREAVERGYDKAIVLGCLLHDGSEAYMSDVHALTQHHSFLSHIVQSSSIRHSYQ